MNDELYHHGIRGQRWGVRNGPPNHLGSSDHSSSEKKAGWRKSLKNSREEKKKEKEIKKNTDELYDNIVKTPISSGMVQMATLSKFGSDDYDQLSDLLDQGKLIVQAQFKKNYENQSVDLYAMGFKDPILSARLENGKDIVSDFCDKADQVRYNEFVEYYNNKHGNANS